MNKISEITVVIKAPKKLIIGDPLYLEAIENGTDTGSEKKLVLIKKRMPANNECVCIITEEEDTSEYGGKPFTYGLVRARIIGTNKGLSEKDKTAIRDSFADGSYFPKLVSSMGELACDTAQFQIETDSNWNEFKTGADGYYGNYIFYKQNIGFLVEMTFDNDLFTVEEIKKNIVALFGSDE